MGLTKQYLRYAPSGTPFGVIGSANSQLACVEMKDGRPGPAKYVATGACENVIIWDTKTGNKSKILTGGTAEVSALASNHFRQPLIAVGYSNGVINVFDYAAEELKVTFSGHKSAVTCVSFDQKGMRLASGGKDKEIVVWDVVGEAGIFRLRGHKNAVTDCQFMKNHPDILVSCSKDTFVKFWDLTTQHCFKTLVAHRSEVWGFTIVKNDSLLITGGNELKVWEISFRGEEEGIQKRIQSLAVDVPQAGDSEDDEQNLEEKEEEEEEDPLLQVKFFGSVSRKSLSRVQRVCTSSCEKLLICCGLDNLVECFKIKTDDEIRTTLTRRHKREKRKLKKEAADEDESEVVLKKAVSDEIEILEPFKVSSKIKYCDIFSDRNVHRLAVLLSSNSVELLSVNLKEKNLDKISCLEKDGHRSDVRTVSFSSDNYYILSASGDCLKVWSRSSKQCIATIRDGFEYALCSVFSPSNRQCFTGTKTGKIQIFDVGSAQLLETVDASEDRLPVWSMCMYPNELGLASGGEDKLVQFWDFELVHDERINTKRLTLVKSRVLDLQEGVLALKISPNGKFIAASLLDSTVKVFFFDTLKFFLSLYGHKFPVLCMDISSDSTLIATGSSDKNIKIWGLDFGDCHKSIFAHDDSVMGLRFIPKTHYLFTCSKDKTVKQWDGDNFEKIVTLSGHQAEVWSLAVSPNGHYLVTSSHDKSLRLWEKTEEPLILEEEKEMEREEEFEKDAFVGEENVIPDERNEETGLAGKKTAETIKATEKLIEAIDVFKEEIATQRCHQAESEARRKEGKEPPAEPARHLLMVALNLACPYRFLLETMKRIKYSELEESLLTLPFNYVLDLLSILTHILEKGWETELVSKCVSFLVRVHFGQILSTSKLIPTMDKLRKLMRERVNELRDTLGVNLAGLQYIQNEFSSREEVSLFTEAFSRLKEKKRKKAKTAVPVLHIV